MTTRATKIYSMDTMISSERKSHPVLKWTGGIAATGFGLYVLFNVGSGIISNNQQTVQQPNPSEMRWENCIDIAAERASAVSKGKSDEQSERDLASFSQQLRCPNRA